MNLLLTSLHEKTALIYREEDIHTIVRITSIAMRPDWTEIKLVGVDTDEWKDKEIVLGAAPDLLHGDAAHVFAPYVNWHLHTLGYRR